MAFCSDMRCVSDVCQINEVDHFCAVSAQRVEVSDVCQINEVDHYYIDSEGAQAVSDVCQINEVDHGCAA